MTTIFLFVLCIFLLRQNKLSRKINACEEQIKMLQISLKETTPLPEIPHENIAQSYALSPPILPPKEPINEIKIKSPLLKSFFSTIKKILNNKSFKIPNIIKENWMGVFGSLVLIMGAVFFGLTTEIMKKPEARVGTMLCVSFLFLGISQKLDNKPIWKSVRQWLTSISGTVVLFATLGASGIEGLRCIHSHYYSLLFLCFGILINILLALKTHYQVIASLHVIMSTLVFCIIPQTTILLLLGAIVVCIGLIAAIRSQWNLHLLLIVSAYTIQNFFWTFSLQTQLVTWPHIIAIVCVLGVGMPGIFMAYRRKYNVMTILPIAKIAYAINWTYLMANLWIHAQFLNVGIIIFGGLAFLGFLLARVAKRNNIIWLYRLNIIATQLTIITALASIPLYSFRFIDLMLLILVETFVFSYMCNKINEKFLIKIGYVLQYITLLIALSFLVAELLSTSPNVSANTYLKLGFISLISYCFYYIGMQKNFIQDTLRYLLNIQQPRISISFLVLFGTFAFIMLYTFGQKILFIQVLALLTIAFVRILKENSSWNLLFLTSFFMVHITNWILLIFALFHSSSPTLFSRIDFLGIVCLDIWLIFGNFLRLNLLKQNLFRVVIYVLGIQIGLIGYIFTQKISSTLPSILFLGYSLIACETARLFTQSHKLDKKTFLQIKECFLHIGLIFLLAFIIGFTTVHLQINPYWNGIPLRLVTELLGTLTLIYWIIFFPKQKSFSILTKFLQKCLPNICLGFLTLSAFIEIPSTWRASVWIVLAIGMLKGYYKYNWSQSFYIYSWVYLMASIFHLAFVAHDLVTPGVSFIDQYKLPLFITIVLQLIYSFEFFQFSKKVSNTDKQYTFSKHLLALSNKVDLVVLLPIFLGIALLLGYNFENTLLTLLWVGISCIYFTIGLIVKSKHSIQIAMLALILCSIRLMIFDLVQSDLAIRAGVFIGVGISILGIGVIYKKYKQRIEQHEKT